MQENLFLTENSLSLGDFGDDDSRFLGRRPAYHTAIISFSKSG